MVITKMQAFSRTFPFIFLRNRSTGLVRAGGIYHMRSVRTHHVAPLYVRLPPYMRVTLALIRCPQSPRVWSLFLRKLPRRLVQ